MKKNIELLKTIVLWVLFISSIALVIIRYNLISYGQISSNNLILSNEKNLGDNILPSHIYMKLSISDMTNIIKNKNEFNKEIKTNLNLALAGKNNLDKIKKEDYALEKKSAHVIAIYDEIPAKFLEKNIGMEKTSISDINFIKEIVFPIDKQEILIKTIDNQYRLNNQNKNNFPRINTLKLTNYDKYYPKFEHINPNTNIILPLKFEFVTKKLQRENILSDIKVADIAQNILKDRFDFSSSLIQKNGDYFYSYNNGKEILKISSNGILQYKKDSVDKIEDDLEKSTNALIIFLKDIGLRSENILIKSVKKLDINSKTIYQFEISHQKDAIPVLMQNNAPDGIIQLIGDTVIYANIGISHVTDFVGEDLFVMDPSKALDSNIGLIKDKLKENDVSVILSKIKDINFVYSISKSDLLEPSWEFKIDKYVFIINGLNGDMVSYELE